MGKRITDRAFFTQHAETLAPALLGKILCHREKDGFVIRGRISVTEAYCIGEDVTDATKAERAGNKTSQHKIGGHLYVQRQGRPGGRKDDCRLDIVAGEEGEGNGESVLIRGIDAYKEGPIIVAGALNIGLDLDCVDLLDPNGSVWLESDSAEITTDKPTRRTLGEAAPAASKEKLLKFTIKEIKF